MVETNNEEVKCETYNGEEVVEFISKCPVEDCTNTKDIHWRHSGCTKKEYITEKGFIICTECNHKFPFFEATFKCGVHENYKPPSKNSQRIIAAFAMIGRLKNSGGKQFIKNLLNNLIDQCED